LIKNSQLQATVNGSSICNSNDAMERQAMSDLCVKLCGIERKLVILPGSWISAKYFFEN
jgi:hypothetical protein